MAAGNDTPIEADAAAVRGWQEAGEIVLIDVRETAEFELEHIPGALLLPLSFLDPDLFPRIAGLKLVMVCAIGKRSAAAAKQLMQAGFADVVNLSGGLDAWKQAGYETEGARFEALDFTI